MRDMYLFAVIMIIVFFSNTAYVSAEDKSRINHGITRQEVSVYLLPADTVDQDSVIVYDLNILGGGHDADSLNVIEGSKYPFMSLEQIVKGNISGIYAQETSGEPGTIQQNVMVRGLSRPVLTAKNFNDSRPLIIVNGIQLIENSDMVYDIQSSEIQPIGAATNILSFFDLDNIESIKVLKDPSTTAVYGPRGANGVIFITTKNAKSGTRMINLNAYSGLALPPGATTVNAEYERNFRQQFYDKYAGPSEFGAYPSYLSDSSNVNYYGPSNWVDEYYGPTPIYSINGSLQGGSDRSNFRFFGNHTSNSSGADNTQLKRYFGSFYVNMLPTTWMTVSSSIQFGRLDRSRNTSLTERYAETRFVPDLTTPFSPNKAMYSRYLEQMNLSYDDNINSSLLASLGVSMNLYEGLNFLSRLTIDYNEDRRDVFWPSTVMSGNNYVSNFFAYNERMGFDNVVTYDKKLSVGALRVEGGLNAQADRHKYNYLQAYRGPNDYIRVNRVNGDRNAANYLQSIGFIPFLYNDRTTPRLLSGYMRGIFEDPNHYQLSALIRRDGSSFQQISERWFTSYAIDGKYNMNALLDITGFDHINLLASYGRMGTLPTSDLESAGPQYTGSLGMITNATLMSYNGIGTISRPYGTGWVNYDVPWSYVDQVNVGLSLAMHNNLSLRVDYYQKDSRNIIFPIPTVAESGYRFEYANGMDIRNNGVDITLQYGMTPNKNKLTWNGAFNIAYNNNKLTSLPNELNEVVVGNRRLEVGQRIDSYWLLQNRGIFVNDVDVPVRAEDYKILTYNGTAVRGGDPRWIDQDGDFDINDDDRVMMGNIIPKWTGGFSNQLYYKNVDLSLFFYFNIGKDILNQNAANQYDFANRTESNSLNSVRNITSWEKHVDDTAYPIYNPWSAVSPYQVEQDMFLEDGSFLKLRNLSLGYDFTSMMKNKQLSKLYVYMTATNLLTITKYSGRDPELVNYYGYDTGLAIPFPRLYSLGVKLGF